MRRVILIVGTGLVVVTVVAGAALAAPHVLVSTDNNPPNIACQLLGWDGYLHGDRWAVPHLWVDSRAASHVRVLWPPGYSAAFEPDLVLRDASGAVVAREGDHIRLDGVGPEPGADRNPVASVCSVERY